MLRTMAVAASITLAAPAGLAWGLLAQPQSQVAMAQDSTAIRNAVPLQRRVTVRLRDVPLRQVLQEIDRQAKLGLAYTSEIVPLERRVTVEQVGVTATTALQAALHGTGATVEVTSAGRIALVRIDRGPARAGVSGTVVGRVTDLKTGVGLPTTDVMLDKTHWRTTTDSAGRYRLADVDTGKYTLTVRRFGYLKQSRSIVLATGKTDTLDLALEPAATRLNEVVSTATGSKRRLEIGNDITQINADSIVKAQPIRNLTQLLEGRVPGLTVQHTSGAPGDPSRLRLRGAGSPLKNNDPIVVVDGMRVYAEQSSARSMNLAQGGDTSGRGQGYDYHGDFSESHRAYATPSPLDQIDPNSIEKVEVFKGPSAAALYGEDAANGVIVITTKKGKAGPTQWSLLADYGRDRIEGNFPELYLRWGHALGNPSNLGFCPISNQMFSFSNSTTTPCVGDSITTYQALNDPLFSPIAPAYGGSGSLSASGGNSVVTYSLTASYQNRTGMIRLPDYASAEFQQKTQLVPPDWMVRPQHLTGWSGTSVITARLGSKADVMLRSQLGRTIQQRSSLEQQLGSLMTIYLDTASGKYYNMAETGQIYPTIPGSGFSIHNILNNYYERSTSRSTDFQNLATLNWRPGTLFTVSTTLGLDAQSRDDELYVPGGIVTGLDSAGRANGGHGTALTTTLALQGHLLEVPLFLHRVRFAFTSGIRFSGTSTRDLTLQSRNLANGTSAIGGSIYGGARFLTDGSNFSWYAEPAFNIYGFRFSTGLQLQQVGSTYGNKARQFFQNLKDQLKFPPNFSTSYMLSETPFFPFKDLFQTFRVRGTFGRASREPGLADRYRVYGVPQSQWIDGGFGTTIQLSNIGNSELRPERSKEIEGGFDADLLNNALSVSLTGYRRTTTDMIMSTEYAPSVNGGGAINTNVGNLRNAGFELSIGGHFFPKAPVGLQAQLVISQNRNKLLSLAPGVQPFYTTVFTYRSDFSGRPSSGARVVAGYPLFGRWSLPIVGYADVDGNGVLDAGEVVYGDTAIYVGETSPNYTAMFSAGFNLFNHALTVSADFLQDGGSTQQSTLSGSLLPFTQGRNVPGTSLGEQLTNIGVGDKTDYASIQRISTFRFNVLTIDYRVPATFARRLGAQSLSISLQGRNLGLWSNYRGLDPNVNAYAVGNSGVLDTGVLPQPRTWQVRINAAY